MTAVNKPAPRQLVEAHQYLYYVKAAPIWSDREYDLYCTRNSIEGGGGSDLESSYSEEIKELASRMTRAPHNFPSTA